MYKIKSINYLLILVSILLLFTSCKGERKEAITIGEYDVIAVSQYIKTETNTFGGVEDTYPCYVFQYVDNGKLETVNNFRDLPYGLQRVVLGDSNKFIQKQQGFDCIEYLQLTKETLENMEMRGR